MIGIFYTSKYGFSTKLVSIIQERCQEESFAVDLTTSNEDISEKLLLADKVIVGGSVYMGRVVDPLTYFLEHSQEDLLGKQVALFVCGLQDEDTIQVEINSNFPLLILNHARVIVHLGGGVDFKKLSWMDKLITKKMMKTSESFEIVHENQLDQLIGFCNTSSRSTNE